MGPGRSRRECLSRSPFLTPLLALLLPAGSAELSFAKEPADATVGRAAAAVLECQARGEGPIAVTWLRNGLKVAESERLRALPDGSLHLRAVEGPADEGFYQCLALSRHGAILSHRARLALASK